jgi:hypothetical protein
MKGKGCAGSIASGVSNGKNIVEEVILNPASLGLGDIAAIDQNNADLGQDAAQIAPDRLLVGGEL